MPPYRQPVPEGPFFIANPATKVVPILRADAPNWRYANLDAEACAAEARARDLPFTPGESTTGVDAPVRLNGPLHGVTLRSDRSARKRSRYEILDCRLVLALDDFAAQLATHHVKELVYFDAYRPATESGCTRRYWGLQHCAALAIDVHAFKHEDGSVLSVERDYHGRIGLPTCVPNVSPTPDSPAAAELMSFVCDAAEAGLFNVMLTPNWNAEHRNHFHLELTPEATWMMVH